MVSGAGGAQVPLAEMLTAPQPSTFPDARKMSLRRSPLGRRVDDMGSPDPETSGEVPAAAGPAQRPERRPASIPSAPNDVTNNESLS